MTCNIPTSLHMPVQIDTNVSFQSSLMTWKTHTSLHMLIKKRYTCCIPVIIDDLQYSHIVTYACKNRYKRCIPVIIDDLKDSGVDVNSVRESSPEHQLYYSVSVTSLVYLARGVVRGLCGMTLWYMTLSIRYRVAVRRNCLLPWAQASAVPRTLIALEMLPCQVQQLSNKTYHGPFNLV